MKFFNYFSKILLLLIIGFCFIGQLNAQQIDIKRGNIFTAWKYKLSTEDDKEYRSIYNKKRPLLNYFENDSLLLQKYLDYLVLNDYKRVANVSVLLSLTTPFVLTELFNSNNFGVLIISSIVIVSSAILLAPILAVVQNFTFKSVMRKYNRQYTNPEDIEIIIE